MKPASNILRTAVGLTQIQLESLVGISHFSFPMSVDPKEPILCSGKQFWKIFVNLSQTHVLCSLFSEYIQLGKLEVGMQQKN